MNIQLIANQPLQVHFPAVDHVNGIHLVYDNFFAFELLLS